MQEQTQCPNCNKKFIAKYNLQKWCNKTCQMEFKLGGPYPFQDISTATRGAMSELLACIDLMKKGYEVYRALSPASSCDVLALKNGKFFDVEVKTGYRSKDNKQITSTTNKNQIKAHYLAIVIHRTNEVVYEPPL